MAKKQIKRRSTVAKYRQRHLRLNMRHDARDKMDISEWNLLTLRRINEILKAGVCEALQYAVEDSGTYAWFSGCHLEGNSPTEITVDIAIGSDEDDFPSWEFDLMDLVKCAIANDWWDREEHEKLAGGLRDTLSLLEKRLSQYTD